MMHMLRDKLTSWKFHVLSSDKWFVMKEKDEDEQSIILYVITDLG